MLSAMTFQLSSPRRIDGIKHQIMTERKISVAVTDNPVCVYLSGTIACITFPGGNHLYSTK